MAEDALVVALCAYVDNNEDIPVTEAATEGQVMVAVPPIVAAKFALYTAMRKQGITAEELGNRLGLGEGCSPQGHGSWLRITLNPGGEGAPCGWAQPRGRGQGRLGPVHTNVGHRR